ncbi:DNA repair helicase (rad3) [compost metagenome]
MVVCDYNYYFDMGALLHGLTVLNDWRVTLLVDEAHNLVERGRGMYTAALDQREFKALRKVAPARLKSVLERVDRHWGQLHREQQEAYRIQEELPELFLAAVQKAVTAITDHLADHPDGNDAALLRFYLDALLFCRLAEAHGPHSLFDISVDDGYRQRLSTLCLRNIVPAPFLAPRFAAAHSTTLFSATLSPAGYYADLLGLPERSRWLEVGSPFSAEQLAVHTVGNLSTRYQDRAASLAPIATLMAGQYAAQPGNYLAFFSSYAYLEQALDALRAAHPQIPVWAQSRSMNEAERSLFLARFTETSRGIGFAVLGGAFGEGIDLPGERLIGAFIATLGLPQVNPVNEEMKARMQAMFGSGFDYAYLYPGLQKVVQAAGRVIRTTQDRGVVYLLDARFTRAEVRRLLPGWWRPRVLRLGDSAPRH